MPLKDQIKNYATKLMEKAPAPARFPEFVRARKPTTLNFADDGIVPNNPRLPVLVYRGAVNVAGREFDPATIVDTIFAHHGWGRSWRDTIYDFVHYHSQVHEVLGVARGTATVELGGIKGRKLNLKAGDIAILPAGTGHRLIDASPNFLVVGAYPKDGTYDECTDTRERVEAMKRIKKVAKPSADPVFGKSGPLTKLWRTR